MASANSALITLACSQAWRNCKQANGKCGSAHRLLDIQDLKNESAQRKQSRAPQAKHEIANFGNERTNKRFEVTQLGAPESMSAALNQGQNKVELFKREPTNGLVFRGQHVF